MINTKILLSILLVSGLGAFLLYIVSFGAKYDGSVIYIMFSLVSATLFALSLVILIFNNFLNLSLRKTIIVSSFVYVVVYQAYEYLDGIACRGKSFIEYPECIPDIALTVENPLGHTLPTYLYLLFILAVAYLSIELIIWIVNKIRNKNKLNN